MEHGKVTRIFKLQYHYLSLGNSIIGWYAYTRDTKYVTVTQTEAVKVGDYCTL